jgi:glycine cleavage system H protein
MSNIPVNLKYLKSHEWVEVSNDGTARIGVTDHAQELLGDMVFVDLPEVGRKVKAGEECAVVESVKAASDVYSPLAGEVVEVNEALQGSPELVNKAPYGDGWLMRLKLANPADVNALLDAAAYSKVVAEEH